eukprot:1160924-Pelagomonas_calceolata.AAC.5
MKLLGHALCHNCIPLTRYIRRPGPAPQTGCAALVFPAAPHPTRGPAPFFCRAIRVTTPTSTSC